MPTQLVLWAWHPAGLSTRERCKTARERAGLDQRTLAALIGTSQPQVCRFERGLRDLPIEELVAWARAVNSRPLDLLGSESPRAVSGYRVSTGRRYPLSRSLARSLSAADMTVAVDAGLAARCVLRAAVDARPLSASQVAILLRVVPRLNALLG